MSKSKRVNFLKSFLKIYGVKKIELINETVSSINGIAIYNESDTEEKQEFIWHKSEKEAPPKELNILIEKIIAKKMHKGDRMFNSIEKLEFSEFDNQKRDKLISLLYDVEIKMINEEKETDSFFVHN
jgi:hypothetical protein